MSKVYQNFLLGFKLDYSVACHTCTVMAREVGGIKPVRFTFHYTDEGCTVFAPNRNLGATSWRVANAVVAGVRATIVAPSVQGGAK